MLEQYFAGHYLIRGLKMLWHPKLRAHIIIPISINIILMIALLLIGIHYFNRLVDWLLHFLPHWLDWLSWLLWLLFAISSMIMSTYFFTIVTNLIAAPFNGLLSEKVQQLVTGKLPSENTSWKDTVKNIPNDIKRVLKTFLYYLPRAFVLVVLLFIPLIQIIVPVLWFIFNAWMMNMQYIDYPMDNNQTSFHDMLKKLHTKRLSNLSFGSCVLLATMIPIVNLIVMPAAVIGSTLFWIEQYKSD